LKIQFQEQEAKLQQDVAVREESLNECHRQLQEAKALLQVCTLCCAVVCCATLCCAALCFAVLCCDVLWGVVRCSAVLCLWLVPLLCCTSCCAPGW
jgi:hypothetical protein